MSSSPGCHHLPSTPSSCPVLPLLCPRMPHATPWQNDCKELAGLLQPEQGPSACPAGLHTGSFTPLVTVKCSNALRAAAVSWTAHPSKPGTGTGLDQAGSQRNKSTASPLVQVPLLLSVVFLRSGPVNKFSTCLFSSRAVCMQSSHGARQALPLAIYSSKVLS